jgi:heat shock protein HtpX
MDPKWHPACRPDLPFSLLERYKVRIVLLLALLALYALLALLLYFSFRLTVSFKPLLSLAGIVTAIWLIQLLWPRFSALPPMQMRLSPEQYPHINRIVEQVARQLQVEKPLILFSEQAMAGIARIGFRQRPVLVLGHPLLALLTGQEVVSLVAHELGHLRDGSLSRTPWFRLPWQTLRTVCFLAGGRTISEQFSFVRIVLHILLFVLTFPLHLLKVVMRLVQAIEYQQSEHIADSYAVQMGGLAASRSLLQKADSLQLAFVQRYRQSRWMADVAQDDDEGGVNTFAVSAALVMPRTLFALHPSVEARLAMMARYQDTPPQIALPEESVAGLQAELSLWKERLEEWSASDAMQTQSGRFWLARVRGRRAGTLPE